MENVFCELQIHVLKGTNAPKGVRELYDEDDVHDGDYLLKSAIEHLGTFSIFPKRAMFVLAARCSVFHVHLHFLPLTDFPHILASAEK